MIDWSKINTVLLDMDGTLLDLHFDNFFWLTHVPKRYAEANQLEFEQAYQEVTAKFRQQEGNLNWYCLDYWSEVLSLDISRLKHEVQHKIAIRPQVSALLQFLQNANIRTLIVTNAHQASIDLKMRSTNLHSKVDGIICSHDFNKPKEHHEFWQKFEQYEPFNKRQTLLIDDSLAVLRSAQKFGIKYLLTINQPDSRQPPRNISEFKSINMFSEIMQNMPCV